VGGDGWRGRVIKGEDGGADESKKPITILLLPPIK